MIAAVPPSPPEEICTLVIEFYKRNYIEGLFLSSAAVKSNSIMMV